LLEEFHTLDGDPNELRFFSRTRPHLAPEYIGEVHSGSLADQLFRDEDAYEPGIEFDSFLGSPWPEPQRGERHTVRIALRYAYNTHCDLERVDYILLAR
jgi:hypothetical protein